ncbi:type II toxin-antitoxin system death-on-curing family toxin [Streptomyces sp. NBC_01020]|uniref:type II toxin-antitoxin system death-on-curing family toxin n=1 Tax=unclassified Streptomyces TaxID=2593676 RepID=UPI002E209296|nr:type II toxin-antitoxin system death-on-curing family toxin [Streptomyces sp. NBC_01020]
MSHVYLSTEDGLAIAAHAVDDQDVVLRDAGLLDSAVHRPSASMFGQEAYPDLFDKAGSLLQSLAINHPFIDGNKRTAWVSCAVFLAMNGVQLRPDIDAAERLVVAVAAGRTEEVKEISRELRALAE